MRSIKYLLLITIISNLSPLLWAQEEDTRAIKELVKASQEEVEALSLYPDDIREAILESSLHPELLVKLNAVQNKTSESFNALISYLPEEDQKKYWELTKYNGLIHKLVDGGQKSKRGIELILKDYPEDIHATALDFGVSRLRTLEKIDNLDSEAKAATTMLLADYRDKTQESIRLLLKFPEVIHLLTENLELVVLVGDLYAKNPDYVKRKADSVQAVVSQRYTEEIKEWHKGLADDPRALQEFEQASSEFSKENGYKEYDPMYPDAVKPEETPGEKEVSETATAYHHHYYPFWFGYPAWFPESYWYWYPYWYHWGYYYGPSRSVVVIGLPSYYFVYWYFNMPYHHYRYPHFSDYVIRYYNRRGPGTSRSGLTVAVRDWERRSQSAVTRQLLADDTRRVERLKEYGRFEQDYQKRTQTTRQPVSREEYLNQNKRNYPNLSGEVKNTIRYNPEPQKKTIRRTAPTRLYDFDRARELHQRTWQRSDYNSNKTRPPVIRTPSRTPTRTKSKRGN